MKKIFALSAVVFLTLSLSSCSDNTEPKITVTDTSSTVTDETIEVEVTPVLSPEEESVYVTALKRLDFSAFSKQALIEQLESEGHAEEDILTIIEVLKLDFNEQAALKAQEYMRDPEKWTVDTLAAYLVKWEYFTEEEAEYGVSRVF